MEDTLKTPIVWRDEEKNKLDFNELLLRAIDKVTSSLNDAQAYTLAVDHLEAFMLCDLTQEYNDALLKEWNELEDKKKFAHIKFRELMRLIQKKAQKHVRGNT